MSTRRAVVLFNLGGPDSLEAVRPFLFNLFNDKAIFHLPQPFRGWAAAFVAKRRAPVAVEIYRHLGGGSPLLANSEDQARALHMALGGGGDRVVLDVEGVPAGAARELPSIAELDGVERIAGD